MTFRHKPSIERARAKARRAHIRAERKRYKREFRERQRMVRAALRGQTLGSV